jgi:hypothetical protein
MREKLKRLADGVLLIAVGIQQDGAVYGLDAFTRVRLDPIIPRERRLRSVVLGHHRAAEIDTLDPPHWPTVVRLLTGLTDEQIAEMGGARIYSIQRDQVLWEWMPEVLSPR